MPGCRGWLDNNKPTPRPTEALDEGICVGMIQGLAYAAPRICPPDVYTTGQALRVVVLYIEGKPARLHEDFMALALEALRAAWPCKP